MQNPLSPIGKIATALRQLQLELLDASVSVRHEEREDIVINANYPSCWEIDGIVVRQTKVMVPSGDSAKVAGGCFIGGSVRQHSRGSVSIDSISVGNGGVFVGGNNSGSISVGPGSVSVGRGGVVVRGNNTGCISTAADRTVINAGGRRIVVENGEVSIDSKKVDGDSESGSDQSAAEAKEAKPTAPDRLEIIVPLAYQGSLIVNNPGDGDIEVDNWCGGNAEVDNYPGGSFDLRLSGSGDFKIGAMKGLGATELRSSGDGDIDIASLQSRDFSARLSGSGDLEIDKIAVNDFTLRQSGSGTATICSGIALSGSVSNSGCGDTSMRGRFAAITKRNSGCGEIKIRVSE